MVLAIALVLRPSTLPPLMIKTKIVNANRYNEERTDYRWTQVPNLIMRSWRVVWKFSRARLLMLKENQCTLTVELLRASQTLVTSTCLQWQIDHKYRCRIKKISLKMNTLKWFSKFQRRSRIIHFKSIKDWTSQQTNKILLNKVLLQRRRVISKTRCFRLTFSHQSNLEKARLSLSLAWKIWSIDLLWRITQVCLKSMQL